MAFEAGLLHFAPYFRYFCLAATAAHSITAVFTWFPF
jgi:hypothetical protein